MSGVLYLAWRYLVYHRIKTAILVTSIALIGFVPVGLNVLVTQSAEQLTERAEATPLLVGARGSPLELVLASLYFESRTPASTVWRELERVADSGLASAIPLHVQFRARGHPIVGTALEYFELRGLELASGRMLAVLGECVVGALAASELAVAPGDSLVSSPETVLDLAGSYPLKLSVVGVLAPANTPDDRAIFVDVKTTWVIAGLGHGHRDLADPAASSSVLAREGDRITANASLVEHNEITPENRASFHFHGDLGAFPLTGVIAVPRDARSRALLLGRYQAMEEPAQIARPALVMAELLETVFTVRRYVVVALVLVAAATLATAALVFLLSLRLRRREIDTLHKLGASRARVAGLVASEVVAAIVLAGALAAALTFATSRLGAAAIRAFLVS